MKHAIAFLFAASLAPAATINQQIVILDWSAGDGWTEADVLPFNPILGQLQTARFEILTEGQSGAAHPCTGAECYAESIGWALPFGIEIYPSSLGGNLIFESLNSLDIYDPVTHRELFFDPDGNPESGSYISAVADHVFSFSSTTGNLPQLYSNEDPLFVLMRVGPGLRFTGGSPVDVAVGYMGTLTLNVSYDYTPTDGHTPEPSTWAVAVMSFIALALRYRYRTN